MTIFELLNKYNFHDSLLEKIDYDEKTEVLKVEIDFCNWQQEWYDEIGEETEMISLIFAGVKNVEITVKTPGKIKPQKIHFIK